MPKGFKGFQKGHKQFNTGRTNFKKGHKLRLGYTHSQETKDRLSELSKGKPGWNRGFFGVRPDWMQTKRWYANLHNWVRTMKGKAKVCEHCGKVGTGRQIHWANIDHSYQRNLDDYISFCMFCNKIYDLENNLI